MAGVFIGSELLASGVVSRYELRVDYRRVLPNVYAPKARALSLRDRTEAAWLWSRREGVVSGLAASALHGSEWVDDDVVIELIWPNHRAPRGVLTRNDTLLSGETLLIDGLPVTTPARTAFDLARRGPVPTAVGRLDALTRAVAVRPDPVLDIAARHPHVRGLRRVARILDLLDDGAESPKESWLRVVLMEGGYPRPQTQIAVPGPYGYPVYRLDMGWPDLMVAVEYDGDQHRVDRGRFIRDIARREYLESIGWLVIKVVAENHRADVLYRVGQAWASRRRAA